MIFRKFALILLHTLFRFVLFFTVSIAAITILYTDPNYIKSVFNENDVYGRVVDSIIETNKDQNIAGSNSAKLSDPEIRQIIEDSFPEQELRDNTEEVIDSTYAWLDGGAEQLQFTIDLSSNLDNLSFGLADYAIERLKTLPQCSEFEAQIDPFKSTCNPTQFDYDNEKQALYQLLNEQGSFIENPVITQDDVFGDQENSLNANENVGSWPAYYDFVKSVPIYLGLILLIIALLIIFTHTTLGKGVRRMGKGLIGVSTTLIAFTIFFSFILPAISGSLPILSSSDEGVGSLLNDVTVDFGQDYAFTVIYLSLPLLIVGIGMLFGERFIKKKVSYTNMSGKVISQGKTKLSRGKKTKTSYKKPPVQSSESSDTKPRRKIKNKKYRKIPKKEI